MEDRRPRARPPSCRDRRRRRTGSRMLSLAIITLTPAPLQFVQRRHAAPTRRAAGVPILQEHIAHRQRDDVDPRPRDRLDRAPRLVRRPAAKASSNVRPGCVRGTVARSAVSAITAKRTRGRIGGFVDVEIEVPTLALGKREKNLRGPRLGAGPCGSPRRGHSTRRRRASPRRSPCGMGRGQTRSETAAPPANRSARASARESSPRPASCTRVCGPMLSICVRKAAVPWA